MFSGSQKKISLTDSIPEPDEVRVRLGEALREASLLRQLLRISEKAQKVRREKKIGLEVLHA